MTSLLTAVAVLIGFSARLLAAAPDGPVLQALAAASTEEEAIAALAPHIGSLKTLEPKVVESVVLRQWWGLARDLVAKSHEQQVDLSNHVRRAVRSLKEEADELLRTLNPKYGQAQQVSPAFQWAQSDTSIFLTIKYTVRWNAPGALEVTEPSVNMTLNTFNFSGLGKHSNNKYRYGLSLAMFDEIKSEESTWSAASVGKLSVTLKKKWPRKWPRLIANKKTKIGNMHMWMEMQERLDSSLGGMTAVAMSPVVCKLSEKLYCLATDTCKKDDQCAQCPGKVTANVESNACEGIPGEKASLTWKDSDMDEGEIAGEVKINKAKNEFDIDTYRVYYGKDTVSKLERPDGTAMMIGETPTTVGETDVRIPMHTKIPEGATHLLVFSWNTHGEFAVPGFVLIKDAVLPKGRAASLSFQDEDPDKGEVSGSVTITRAADEHNLEEYALHWGRSDKRKISSSSYIKDVLKTTGKDPSHYISSSTKIPDGASHILAFSKNEHGENSSPASIRIVDALKPCQKPGDSDCPKKVSVTPDGDNGANKYMGTVTIERASAEDNVSQYSLYWGRKNCDEGGLSGAKNGLIQDLPVKLDATHVLSAGTVMPEGTTHILAFSKSRLAESENCVAVELQDVGAAPKLEL